tara:strand:+ start:294 stop:485 length:192 start_codon:yes stop_codon:yes gene_type:complete
VGKLKIYYQLQKMRSLLQKDKVVEAYACLLRLVDNLEEELLYRDAKKDWHDMNKEFQNDQRSR